MRTGRITQLTKSRFPSVDGRDEAEAYFDSPIGFSPNGRYIVYGRQLWEDSEMRIYDLQKNRDLGFNIGQLFAWSSDSKYIMAASSWYMDEQVPTRIIKWNLDTLKYRTVLRNYRVNDIIWPKGLGFVWVSLENPIEEGPKTDLRPPRNPGIYKLNPANGALTSVSKITDWIMTCPNYRRFAFLSQQPDNPAASALCVGELKTWRFSLIANDASNQWNWHEKFELMSWSPNGKSLAYVTKDGDIRIVKFTER